MDLIVRRRAIVKDIAYGLRETFNSRNNDFGGYWGIGVLYRHAVDREANEVTLDLLSRAVEPDDRKLTAMAAFYSEYVQHRATRFELPPDWISSAKIRLRFNCNEGAKPFRAACGDPYVLEVTVQAKTGFIFTSTVTGYCWPHNPKRESRRLVSGWGVDPDRAISGANERKSLGLDSDLDDVEFIERLEQAFGQTFAYEDPAGWYTVRDVFDTLKSRLDVSGQHGEKCPSAMAFNRIRETLRKLGVEGDIRPDTNLATLIKGRHDPLFKLLEAQYGWPQSAGNVNGPGCLLLLIATMWMVWITLSRDLVWGAEWLLALGVIFAFGWVGSNLPRYFKGTVGKLAKHYSSMNFNWFVCEGATIDEPSLWQALQVFCMEWIDDYSEDIGEDTFLLDPREMSKNGQDRFVAVHGKF